MQYFSLITEYGLNKQIQALNNDQTIKLTKMAVGSGDGEITQSQTTLQEQKYEFFINSIEVDENNKNQLIATGVIPSDIGGFYIKEVGIFDDSKNLFAIGKIAPTYKPLLSEGSAKDLTIKFYLQVENVSNIELKIDPSVVIATRKWTLDNLNKKVDKLDVFTKIQSDERYLKKEALPSYTKQEVDNLLKNKRDNDETALNTGQLTFKEFLLDLSDCDLDTYYPCVSSLVSVFEEATFKILFGVGPLNGENKKDWMTHRIGFSMSTEWSVNGSGYGNAEIVRNIKKVKWLFTKNNQSPILKINQFPPTSQEYFYLRGGGRYTVYVNRGISVVAHKEAVDLVAADGVKITLPPIKYDELLVPEETKETLIPVGTIIQSASQTTPQGYLKCNGASISRSNYQKLFKAIGTTFGNDDSNTFKLPDLRGRFIRGFSDGSSIDSGRAFGSSQDDAIRNITGGLSDLAYQDTEVFKDNRIKNNRFGAFYQDRTFKNAAHTGGSPFSKTGDYIGFDASRVVPTANDNRPYNIALNFYIKY